MGIPGRTRLMRFMGEKNCASTLCRTLNEKAIGVSGCRSGAYEVGSVKIRRREGDRRNERNLSKSRKLLVINVIFFGLFFEVGKKCANLEGDGLYGRDGLNGRYCGWVLPARAIRHRRGPRSGEGGLEVLQTFAGDDFGTLVEVKDFD